LDAYCPRLYGLTCDELRYILDPKDLYGDDFPGEAFRVLTEKEIKQHGDLRSDAAVGAGEVGRERGLSGAMIVRKEIRNGKRCIDFNRCCLSSFAGSYERMHMVLRRHIHAE
jgi:hypothetical protein